ncbi:response regulator receiver protein [Caballeronia sordidicola]|uniref:Response regulator receiver protein n=1 Tax=Caballeronia sordidicola TaxID=196367 RepID=A0A158FQ32_CABSO|nr:response regulator [Caballeronia sordidicola]SAL21936.1 response regulator receiver protein [Caballeronia sordidicola]
MTWQSARARLWTGRKVTSGVDRFRVLVVDDNQDAADALAMYLEFENLELRTAYGGKQAVDVAIAWTPHVVVMDISMPECNGYEAAKLIRAHAHTSHVAMIAFTAFDEHEVRRHLTDHEFDAYCQKGEPPSRLVALLARLTEK